MGQVIIDQGGEGQSIRFVLVDYRDESRQHLPEWEGKWLGIGAPTVRDFPVGRIRVSVQDGGLTVKVFLSDD